MKKPNIHYVLVLIFSIWGCYATKLLPKQNFVKPQHEQKANLSLEFFSAIRRSVSLGIMFLAYF